MEWPVKQKGTIFLFTSLCVLVDGIMGREATRFVQHLADQLSSHASGTLTTVHLSIGYKQEFICHHPYNNIMSQRITYKMAVSGHNEQIFLDAGIILNNILVLIKFN